MGYDYALVHLYYTIPPALLLTAIYYPLFTRTDVYKIIFLITIAVTATIPWDSYLIRNSVWSYPTDAVVGPTLLDIPAEELFFFVIQTYNTSLLYLLLSKPTFHPVYPRGATRGRSVAFLGAVGSLILGLITAWSWYLIAERGEGFYVGLIVAWAGTFMTLLWALAHQFLLTLPWTNTLLPILAPTLYLWVVDTIALRRGTWVIETGTKLGIEIWRGLDVEEALFFFVTNCMIVFGLVAFDNALAIIHTFPHLFQDSAQTPSPQRLIVALMLPRCYYDESRVQGLHEALNRLRGKSRSFYLASSVFQGRLRIDLVLLYSFCRVADDLIDDAGSLGDARHWLKKLSRYLDLAYGGQDARTNERSSEMNQMIDENFPVGSRSALKLLPVEYLSAKPLYELLEGFEMDLQFEVRRQAENRGENDAAGLWPIADQKDLHLYGERVAGTVAELCIELVYHHIPDQQAGNEEIPRVLQAGREMGVALQIVNIARDISVDACIHRIYVPLTYLKAENTTPRDMFKLVSLDLNNQPNERIERLRQQLLVNAFTLYRDARVWIEKLPAGARGPMRVAVESYMEIGRVLEMRSLGKKVHMKRGRATVPKLRRVTVAWRALTR